MKKLTLAATLAFLSVPAVHADTVLGIYAGAGTWNADYSGAAGNPSVTLKDLGMKDSSNNYYYIALEHPIPLIPNILIEQTDISSAQRALVDKSFTIAGTIFDGNDTIASDFDFSHTDATLYYEILDNWVNLDIGITARKFDGYARANSIISPSDRVNVKLDQTLPMIYSKVQFDLPFTGFSAGGDLKYISFDGDKISDFSVKLSYLFDSVIDLGVEAGYRQMSLEVDDNGLKTDADVKGPYAAVIAHF